MKKYYFSIKLSMEPLVTVIASAFEDPVKLMQMVCNFHLQTRKDFILHIVHDGENETLRNYVTPLLGPNMFWTEVEGPNGKGNFAGRNLILDSVTTPYVMFASDDNYYPIKTFEIIIPHLESQKIDMIIFKCIHNYFNYIYEVFKDNSPFPGSIDLCQFIVKTKMVLDVGKFKINIEVDGTQDGELCERIRKTFPDMIYGILPNCLLVHN